MYGVRKWAVAWMLLAAALLLCVVQPVQAQQADGDPLDAQLQAVLSEDPVYEGAWLYSRNCARCHLDYVQARQGQGISIDVVEETITNGKAGTIMPGFALTKGGTLKRRQIGAVVAYISAWEDENAAPELPEIVIAAIAPSLAFSTTAAEVVTDSLTVAEVAQSVTSAAPAQLSSKAEGAAIGQSALAPAVAAAPAVAVAPAATGASFGRLIANGLTLSLYCLCGAPVLLLVLIGLLFASQLGYRGSRISDSLG